MLFEIIVCVVFKASFINMLSNIMQLINIIHGLPYVTTSIDKGRNTIVTRD